MTLYQWLAERAEDERLDFVLNACNNHAQLVAVAQTLLNGFAAVGFAHCDCQDQFKEALADCEKIISEGGR